MDIKQIFDRMLSDFNTLEHDYFVIEDEEEMARVKYSLMLHWKYLMDELTSPVRLVNKVGDNYHIAKKDDKLVVIEAGYARARFFIWQIVDDAVISTEIDDIIFIWGLMGYDIDYKTYYGFDENGRA